MCMCCNTGAPRLAVASSSHTTYVNPMIFSILSGMCLDPGPFPSPPSAISLGEANAVSMKALGAAPPGLLNVASSGGFAHGQPGVK